MKFKLRMMFLMGALVASTSVFAMDLDNVSQVSVTKRQIVEYAQTLYKNPNPYSLNPELSNFIRQHRIQDDEKRSFQIIVCHLSPTELTVDDTVFLFQRKEDLFRYSNIDGEGIDIRIRPAQ